MKPDKEFKFVSALSPKVCHDSGMYHDERDQMHHFVGQLHYTIEVMQHRSWGGICSTASCFQVGRHFSFCALIIDR